MKHNPDNRKDNVEKIQCNISNTIKNIHLANEMIEVTDDDNMKQTLKEKNCRREEALKGMREEIKEESIARENNYK
ncbi:small acid-soluble spore protein Tlp [Clostridium sp. Ade.TY]|uniref:small acid-soluble spore protein Tlp n=1 Tax=Clostridium sp. Ade.TY TaxID=1391647 RepID=UPI0003FE888C|nr:small acid-soluble spore protein Tlp [Clostridium sp. Ade.TY]